MRYLSLLLVVLSFGCNNQAEAPLLTEDSAKPDGTQQNDTLSLSAFDTTTLSNIKIPQGFYSVQIPCKGCIDIEHTVLFQPDKTYILEETELVKTASTVRTTGAFNPASGFIWAYKGQVVKARYTWKGDTLLYLLPNGQPIAMQKLTAATDNDVWRRKGKEGLTFYGIGTEPFWNFEVNKNKSIDFLQSEWTQPLRFTNSTSARRGDSTFYFATSDSASLQAIIYNRFCSDGMSDYIYTHTLEVLYNGKRFSGCGIRY
jgi:uncharacterized membrane protein